MEDYFLRSKKNNMTLLDGTQALCAIINCTRENV